MLGVRGKAQWMDGWTDEGCAFWLLLLLLLLCSGAAFADAMMDDDPELWGRDHLTASAVVGAVVSMLSFWHFFCLLSVLCVWCRRATRFTQHTRPEIRKPLGERILVACCLLWTLGTPASSAFGGIGPWNDLLANKLES